jgi:hypothetical protein
VRVKHCQAKPRARTPHSHRRIQQKRCVVIKKVAGGYKVLSENGKKNLGGPYKTKKEAEKRLKQVEFFKRRKG